MTKSRTQVIPSWFALANVLSASDTSDDGPDLALSFGSDGAENLALAIGAGETARGSEFTSAGQNLSIGDASGSAFASETQPSSSTTHDVIGGTGPSAASASPGSATGSALTIANGATVEIDGPSGQSVTFAGTTGTLKLQDAVLFTGLISGLAGADAIDLSGFAYGANVTATYLGNTTGGTLTVADGAKTARIALSGDYLSSTWTLSSDGKGGTTVVDPTTSANWQTLDVGGGGWVTGISIANDGTMVVRTDTNGAYLWNGSQWVQLITTSSMPAAFDFSGEGVYEIQVAPSNSSIMYMTFDGYVFKTTNKGTTWTQTAFAGFNDFGDASNDSYRMNGQKMAIDPNNPNIVYVGTPSNGMYVTTNGGSTWSQVSAIPAAAGEGFNIVFDPAVGGVVSGVTQTIFASSYGNGVYESTNGGATWTALSGGPTNVEFAAVSSTGVYYAASDGNLWSYASGTWKELISGNNGGQGIQAVAVNPSNPNEIVAVAPSGYLNISYNAGSTWTGLMWSSNEVTSADIPWLADAQRSTAGRGITFTRRGGVQSGQSESDDPHRRHRSVDHHPSADVERDAEHESDLDRPNRRHRKCVLSGNPRSPRRRSDSRPIRSALLRHHQSQCLSLDLRPGGSGQYRRRIFGRLRLVRPEFHCRPRRLVGRGGVGLFHQRRTDVDEIRNRHPRGRLVRSSADRSPPARRKTSSGLRRTATNPIIRSMEARPGAPSRSPA